MRAPPSPRSPPGKGELHDLHPQRLRCGRCGWELPLGVRVSIEGETTVNAVGDAKLVVLFDCPECRTQHRLERAL